MLSQTADFEKRFYFNSPLRIARGASTSTSNPAMMASKDLVFGMNSTQIFSIQAFNEYSFFLFNPYKNALQGLYLTYQPTYSFGFVETAIPFNLRVSEQLHLGLTLGATFFNNGSDSGPATKFFGTIGTAHRFTTRWVLHVAVGLKTRKQMTVGYSYLTGIQYFSSENLSWEACTFFPNDGSFHASIGGELMRSKSMSFRTGITMVIWSYYAGIQLKTNNVIIDFQIKHFSIPGSVYHSACLYSQ